jgi:hypothetical protein
MWYASCTGWEMINGRFEPRYHIKYAESVDGISWRRSGLVCIEAADAGEAIGRPCVFRRGGRYVMLYSYRRLVGYRTDRTQSYRLGYAESADGLVWTRRDDLAGIGASDAGWDHEMIEYCYCHTCDDRLCLFYNGDGFGRSGFGYAVLDESSVR